MGNGPASQGTVLFHLDLQFIQPAPTGAQNREDNTVKNFVYAAIIVAVIVIGPILMIWSLNTLFGLGIDYSLKTWFAALIVSATIQVGRSSSRA